MAYADCRSHIETVLEGVAITSPLALSIAKVYDDPPMSLEDVPCFILFGSSGRTNWSLGGVSTAGMEEHEERCGLIVHDEDFGRGAELVRAFRLATLTAFQNDQGLGGHGIVSAFRWEAPEPFTYAGRHYVGQDFFVAFTVKVS